MVKSALALFWWGRERSQRKRFSICSRIRTAIRIKVHDLYIYITYFISNSQQQTLWSKHAVNTHVPVINLAISVTICAFAVLYFESRPHMSWSMQLSGADISLSFPRVMTRILWTMHGFPSWYMLEFADNVRLLFQAFFLPAAKTKSKRLVKWSGRDSGSMEFCSVLRRGISYIRGHC